MNIEHETPGALQAFEPEPERVYSIEMVSRLVHIPRHTILVYCKHGLVSPVADPERSGYHFNDEAIRALRRIEYLRAVHGINISGARLILELFNEVERLRAEVRFLRG